MPTPTHRPRGARSRLVGVCAAGLAAGCLTVGPDYARPSAPVAEAWTDVAASVVVRPDAATADWWAAFGDPVLARLVVLACERNPTFRVAGLRVLEARARRGIAIGGLFPQRQDAIASYTATRGSEERANVFEGVDTSYEEWQAGFDAAWELDLWGRFRRTIEAADAALDAAEASREDALVSLVGEVARAYVELRTLEERLAVAHANVALQARGHEIADARYAGGAVTALDAEQAASLLADTRALIPALEASLHQTRATLALLVGVPPGDVEAELGEHRPIPAPPAEIAVGVPAELLRRRPDVRAAERRAAAQSAAIGVAASELYPHLVLTGRIGVTAADAAGIADGRAFEAFGGPSLRWAILNYGRISNDVRAEDARFEALVAEYEATVLRAQAEVVSALAALVGARRRVVELERSVEAAGRAVELAQLQYREGAVDYTRVLDTQQFLVAAEDRLVTTKGDVALAVTALYKAVGGAPPQPGEDAPQRRLVPAQVSERMRARTRWGALLEEDAAAGRSASGGPGGESEGPRGWEWWPLW